jgi:ubiquinone/menaquinone biosynthesis C-methylase UbiE
MKPPNVFGRVRSWLEGPYKEAGTLNERTRIAWVEEKLRGLASGGRILDAGAGEQRWKKSCSHLRYVAQDFAQYDGKGDARGLQTGGWDQTKLDIISDITSIPEPDQSFDAIMCIEVLEHLPNPIEALAEFSRLLRPGGHLILTAPFCSLTHFAPYHFATGFNRYFYEKQLPAHGFEVLELTPNGNFFEFVAQEIRRAPEVGRLYAGTGPGILEKLALSVVLRLLGRWSVRDKGSSELLHFDYQVLGVRK